jgi:hypothetical protein
VQKTEIRRHPQQTHLRLAALLVKGNEMQEFSLDSNRSTPATPEIA